MYNVTAFLREARCPCHHRFPLRGPCSKMRIVAGNRCCHLTFFSEISVSSIGDVVAWLAMVACFGASSHAFAVLAFPASECASSPRILLTRLLATDVKDAKRDHDQYEGVGSARSCCQFRAPVTTAASWVSDAYGGECQPTADLTFKRSRPCDNADSALCGSLSAGHPGFEMHSAFFWTKS